MVVEGLNGTDEVEVSCKKCCAIGVVVTEFGVEQRLLGEFGTMVCIGDGRGGGDADQAVEDEAKGKSTTLFSSGASSIDITEDIGVAYALVGISSSVIVAVDNVGVGDSNDCIENGR